MERYSGREVSLGGSTVVRRLLPNRARRLVGAWCFVDHYGPDDIADADGMQVPPHPHIGLQTVSWLLDGEVRHRDSLGNDQLVRPGQLGLMTAGRGIAHAEHSPVAHVGLLHGVQLWVALPGHALSIAPAWAHHADLPTFTDGNLVGTVILGELGGQRSPGRTHSPLVGVDLDIAAGGSGHVPLEPDFEYAVLAMSGAGEVRDEAISPGSMLFVGRGSRDLSISSEGGVRVLLLGGEPFGEEIVMWWNFVGRSSEEIAEAREAWMAGERFGSVVAAGAPTPAPALPPGRLTPGGSTRR